MRFLRTNILVGLVINVFNSLENLHGVGLLRGLSPSVIRNLVSRVFQLSRVHLASSRCCPSPVSGPATAGVSTLSPDHHSHFIISRLDPLYFNRLPSRIQLDACKLSLPEVAATASLEDLSPPEVVATLRDPTAMLETDDSLHTDHYCMSGVTHNQYLLALSRMLRIGMISLERSAVCVNGMFAVPKDDSLQRIIIDTRPANSRFKVPPWIKLASPDYIAKLKFPPGSTYYTFKLDIDNFYLRLRLPSWMLRYFALPPVWASTIPGYSGPEFLSYPCICVLPPGWSWSVYLSQLAHEQHLLSCGLEQSSMLTRMNDRFIVDRLITACYIDDLVGFSPFCADATLAALLEAYHKVGLTPKLSKLQWSSSAPTKVLGLLCDPNGPSPSLRLDPVKMHNLIQVTAEVLRFGRSTAKMMEVLVGYWIWAMLVVRPAFSIFNAVWKFMRAAASHAEVFTLWPSVVKELSMALHLAPLMVASLRGDVFRSTVAFDASLSGFGVLAAPTLPLAPNLTSRDRDHLPTIDVQLHDWRPCFNGPWRFDGHHINSLELGAALLSVRWSLSHMVSDSSVRLITDSTVTLGVLAKGRSSSYRLACVMRKISALCLVAGLSLDVRWVESALNPADASSRAFS